MPDFDKNLRGTQKDASVHLEESYSRYPQPGKALPGLTPLYPENGGQGEAAVADDYLSFMSLASNKAQNSHEKGVTVTLQELEDNKRFKAFNPTIDNYEDFAAQGQSTTDKVYNGLVKFAGTTATTLVSGTVGTIYGLGSVASTGKFSSFYDNPLAHQLDEASNYLENSYGHYKTARQQKASWYEPENLLSANFLMDGIVKNLGFSLGAMGAGFAWGGLFKAIGLTSRLMAVGGESAIAADKAIAEGAMQSSGMGIANTNLKLEGMLNQGKAFAMKNVIGKADQHIVNIFATSTEAGIEALNNSQEYRKRALESFKTINGREPNLTELNAINKSAEDVGFWSFWANSAVLSVTNHIQLPKIYSSSFKSEKTQLNHIALDASGDYVSTLPAKGFGRFARKSANLLSLGFNTSEGTEEGLQFAIQTGTQNYFHLKEQGKKDLSILDDGVLHGLKQALTTEEGTLNIFTGAFSGALQSSGVIGVKNYMPVIGKTGKIGQRGWTGYGGEQEAFRNEAIAAFNKTKLKDRLVDIYANIKAAEVIQEQRQRAIELGDILESKDLEFDYAHTFVSTRVKYGAKEFIDEEVRMLKEKALSPGGFEQLKKEGKTAELDTPTTFIKRLDNLQEHANVVEQQYDSVNRLYSGQLDKDGKRKYSDDVIDKLVYTAAKVYNYNKRLPEVTSSLTVVDADIASLLDKIRTTGVVDNEIVEAALASINSMDIIQDEKTKLITALNDSIELTLLKKDFVESYNEIVNSPDKFAPVTTTKTIIDENGKAVVVNENNEPVLDENGKQITKETISITTKKGQRDLIIGEEYYLGRTAYLSKGGHEMYFFPKLKILGKNEDGTIRIEDKNGERNVSPEALANYNLGLVSETNSNKKAKYYMDNINTPFYFNFGKNAKGEEQKIPGRLEYNPTDGVLDFVYLDTRYKTPKVKRIEVTREQFKPQGKFKEAMIVAGAPLTLAEQKTLDEFTEDKTHDPRISEKNEKRLAILLELFDDIVSRREKFASQVEAKKSMIETIKKQISELNTTIANTPVDKRKSSSIRFKKATRVAMEAAIKLSNTQRTLEQEIELLETQQTELSVAQAEVETLIENVDQMPGNTKEFLGELKEEVVTLEDLHKSNSGILKELTKLVASTERAINSAIDFLGSMITSFESKYPNVPRVMGQGWVDFLTSNPNFLKLKPNYKEELSQIDDSIANIEEETIVPNQARLENLQEHLAIINGQLIETEKLIKAKGIIIARFEGILNKYKTSLEQKEVVEAMGENKDNLSNSLDTSIQTTEAFEDHEDYEEASKKADLDVVSSTIASFNAVKSGNESAIRALRFGNRFIKLSANKTFKSRLVTYNTEALILGGMFNKLFPGAGVDEKEQMIAMVITDEEGNLVDEFGESISLDNPKAVDLAIYQVMPAKELKQMYSKDGGKVYETMFRASTSNEEKIRLTALYGEWRDKLINSQEVAPLMEVTASFGFPEEVEDSTMRTDVQAAGLLDVGTLLDTNVITVATVGDTVVNGSFSLKTQLGMVFLALPNTLVKLYNRKFNIKEASVIYSGIERLSMLAQTKEGLRTAEATTLFEWLRSTIYWGIARNMQTGVRKETPGKNNVWFEDHPVTGEPTLFVGEDSFPFTPEGLKLNKQIILSKLLEMYGNTNAPKTRKSLTNTYAEVIGFNEDYTPKIQLWPNYQSYLLSNKAPDADGLLTQPRNVEEIPLNTKIRPLKGNDDFNRTGIYFTMLNNVDTFRKPKEEIKAEEIVKTTPSGEKTQSNGFTFDGTTTNTINLGKIGSIDFKMEQVAALDLLTKYGPTILAPEHVNDFITYLGELIEKGILVFNELDSKTVDELILQGIASTDEEANILVQAHAGKQIVSALVPLLVLEEIQEEVVETIPVPKPAKVKPVPPAKAVAYTLDGIEVNSMNYNGEEAIAFTVDGKVIEDALAVDADAFNSPAKILDKAFEYLQSKTIAIDFTEENEDYFTKQNAELVTQGKPELSGSDILQSVAYVILSKTVKQIQDTVTVTEEAPVVVAAEETVEEEETPVDDTTPKATIITGNGGPRRRRSANRTKMANQIKQFDEEVWETLTPELEAMLPQLPVFRIKNIIQTTNGREAWGMFRDGAIYIYKNAEAGTGYHEVFEAVWAMFTDIAERKTLIKEFRSRPGTFREHGTMAEVAYKDATSHQAKEEMAEEFRRYLLDKKEVKEKSLLRRLFDNMVEFFESFFFGPKAVSNTEELFSKIGNGYYAKYNQYTPALSIAKQGVIDLDTVISEEGDEYKIATLSAKEEHELFQHMTFTAINSLIGEGKSFFTITKKLSGAEMYNEIRNEILGDEVNNIPGIIDDMYLDLTDNLQVGTDDAFTNKRAQDVLALKQRVQDAWPELVKLHKKYLLSYSITFDENDNAVLEDETKPKQEYGESNKVDSFKKASAAIKLLFATIPDSVMAEDGALDYIPSTINGVTFMGTDKVFINLMNALHGSTDITEMLKNLAKLAETNVNYATVYKRLTKRLPNDGKVFDKKDLSKDDIRLLTSFWNVVNKQNPTVLTVITRPDGETIVSNTSLTDAARQNRYAYTNAIIKSMRDESSKYFSYNKKTKVFNPTSALLNLELDTKTAESAAIFLKNLGIDIDGAMIESWKKTTKDSARTDFINSTKGLLASLKQLKDVQYLSSNTINASNNLLGIGTIGALIKTPIFETVYYNLEREKVQSFIGPNFSSSFYSYFSKIKSLPELAHTQFGYLTTDVFAKNSVIFRKVFNPMTNKRGENTENIMEVVYVNGTIDDVTEDRTPTSRLDYSGRVAQEINLNLDGVYLNLVPGDAELEWGVRMHEKDSPFVSNEDIQAKSYQRIFRGYFIDEVNLSREARIVAPGRNTKDLRFFKDILGTELHDKIVNNKKKLKAEELYTEYEKEISSAVDKYVNQNTKNTKELLLSYGLITKTEEGYVTSLGFFTNEMTDDTMDLELKRLSINYIIANTEFHKLLYSDPYQYEDELKRIKNYNSPRQMLADSPELNLEIHNTYNKGYVPGDKGYYDMTKDHFRTIVFEEINASQDVSGLEGYDKAWKEGDGGGLILEKAKRLLRIKASNWTENDERQYRHDVIYEEIVDELEAAVEADKPSILEKLSQHEKNNPAVHSIYTPDKPIVAGSKDNGRDYNDQILDKYALFTLSFRLLHKLNPNSDAIKLYRKMSKENIDYGVFASARKVGQELVSPLYDDNGEFDTTPFESEEQIEAIAKGKLSYKTKRSVTNVPFKIMGIQTDVPTKDKFEGPQASQITKLATMDFRQGGVPIDYVPEGVSNPENFNDVFISWMKLSEREKQAKSELYKEITHNKNLLEARTEKGYQEVLKLLGIQEINGGFELVDREKLISTLESEILKQEVNNNILDALESFRNEGTTVILEATPAYQQVRYILYALSNSRVVKPKITGGQKVQMFSSLFLSSGRKIKEVTKKGKHYLVSDDLKFYTKGEGDTKTNECEIMIARWFKSPLSDKELLEYLNTTEEGQKILKGIAFRIPTQKQNSIEAFVIKEFLPAEYGDTVILPSEIVQKAGSDFDIDKLSMYLKKVFLNKKGEPSIVRFLDNSNSTVEERYHEYVKDVSESLKEDMLIAKSDPKVEAMKEVIDETYDEAKALGEQIETLIDSGESVYREGLALFKKLSIEVKDKYWELNDELNSRNITGIGKTLFFRDLTTEFLKNKKVENTAILKKMLINYDRVLENKGLTEAKIAEVKDAFKAAHITKDLFTPQIRDKVTKILADLSGAESLEEFSKLSIFKQNTKAALDNEYISSLERLVTHPSNFDNLVKPNSAKEMKDLTKKINTLLQIDEISYDAPGFMLDRKNMSGLRNAFVTGKRAIGIAAVGQTNNALNQGFLSAIDSDKLTMANFSPADLLILDDGKVKFNENSYNSVVVNGELYPTLSKIKNAAGKYISDIVGMFIDGYVDISKGPWIMELGATPKTAGTWLFLVKLGVPIDTVALFMNQPAIKELIKQSEITGASLYDNDLIYGVLDKYDAQLDRDQIIPSNNQLEEMVGERITFSQGQKEQQVFMLHEFLKYSKMASQLYEAVQATNVDTANINDPFLMYKKETELDRARKNMMVSFSMKDGELVKQSMADAILETTFIGGLNDKMHKIRNAHSLVLLSDKPRLRTIFQNILSQYVATGDREFVRISRGLVADLFDWAVSTDRKFGNTLKKVMLGTATEESAANEIISFRDSVFGNKKKNIPPNTKHPLYGNFALEAMSLIPGNNDKTADNIQLIGRDNKVYDQNRIINSFEEIKEYFKNQNNIEFYGKIVRLAIMQSGMSNSRISFANLLPYDDFREIYDKTLSNLEELETLDDFENLQIYQRINYSNSDIVQPVKMTPSFDYNTLKFGKSNFEKQVPLVLQEAMNNKEIPKVIVKSGGADVIKLTWMENISPEEKAIRARTGNTSHFKAMLMRKVYRDAERTLPLLIERGKGKNKYTQNVFVAINGWGNSYRAKEFYSPRTVDNNGVSEHIIPASIFDNKLEKVELLINSLGNKASSQEVSDDVIVNLLEKSTITNASNNKILKMQPDNVVKILNKTKTITNRTEKEKLEDGIYILPNGTSVEIKNLGLTTVQYIGDGILISSGLGKVWTPDEYAKAEGFKNWEDFKTNNKFSANFINGTQSRYVYSVTPNQKEALSLQSDLSGKPEAISSEEWESMTQEEREQAKKCE